MTAAQPINDAAPEAQAGLFINAGTHSGWFTTPDGDIYDIRKLEPGEVTGPRSGEVTTIWGGYATARDRANAARDAMLQTEFKKTGTRPAELFAPEARDIPLYITLRNRPGKGYTDIASFWNAKSRYTILARDLAGKSGLRFGGNVLAWKPSATADADATGHASKPDADAARQGAAARGRKGRDKAATATAEA